MSIWLGQLLLKEKLITAEQLEEALKLQKTQGGRLGNNLIKLGYLTENDLTNVLSKQYNVPSINLSQYEIDPTVLKLISPMAAKKYMVVPVNKFGPNLLLAMCDPSNVAAIDEIKFMTGLNVEVVVAAEAAIIDVLKKYYGSKGVRESSALIEAKDYDLEGEEGGSYGVGYEEEAVVDVEEFDTLVHGAVEEVQVTKEEEETSIRDVEAPIVKLVNGVLIRAIKMGVSDVHVEPYEKSFRIRYRQDGVLKKVMGLPLKLRNPIISRLKIMSQLDIAERRLPQDGRIKLKLGARKDIDFRVSVLPTLFGEKVVLRLLDKSNLQLDMTKLGFEEKALKDFKEAIEKPYGMVLVTGPTGSGKTTTLYSALSELNKEGVNIMTAEDPVEFNLMGINQVQMKESIGLTFAAALRSFLRQDPDIIMVGEMRDYETAEIGIKAALTGHLVLSTLHTNDAPGTIARLLNMGAEPFLVASATNLILAQRLARKICVQCKEEIEIPQKALINIGVPPEEVEGFVCYKGKGCATCGNTGGKGRVALYEVMPIKEELRDLILQGAPASELKKTAMRLGMKTLRQSGIVKVKEGVISVEEVVKVTMKD